MYNIIYILCIVYALQLLVERLALAGVFFYTPEKSLSVYTPGGVWSQG